MATKTNLYMDKILLEHPIAAWTLDEDFDATGPFADLDSFYTLVPVVIPTQSMINVGGEITFITTGNHGLVTGDFVTIAGITPTGYNNNYKVIATPATNTFKVNGSTTGNITVAGTVTKHYSGYELTAYNSSRYPGYVWSTNPLVSKVPMVYGSGKAQNGSFILPSFGFLSSNGKYNQYTFETWVKIRRTADTDKRKLIGLFDNSASTDDGNGLYYNNTSFILKIGNKSDAAYIKQTNKPLLIHIGYSESSASLYVNGEQLINLVLDEEDLALLATPTNNKDYISLQSATFDCPAIYPYRLSATQAKVHYAYGQAVTVPETINKSYGGQTVSIDFPSAGYGPSQNYPTNGQWKNAISDNLQIEDYSISNKEFDLPAFNLYDTTTEEIGTIEDVVTALGSGVWNMKSGTLSSTNSNIEFASLNLFNSGLKAFYADYSVTNANLPTTEKTIFKIINKINKNYLKITMQYIGAQIEIKYWFRYNSSTETLLSTKTNAHYYRSAITTSFFFIGMDIDKFATSYDTNIRNFFNNLDQLAMFVFGDNDLTKDTTPNASINGIKFLTQFELDKRGTYLVDSTGRFFYPSNAYTSTNVEAIVNAYPANYEVKYIQAKNTYNTSYTYSSTPSTENYFTVGSSGYWKNDTPLKHFAKYVKDGSGNDVYTFNNIQFNVDYDAPTINLTGVLKQFDTSLSNAKTYITFEPISSTYKTDGYFTNGIKKLNDGRVVRPDANWATTKYEVVDGTIIYPPTGVDISTLTLVQHIDIAVSDIINNTVNIKHLELASQALSLNTTTQNPVYTKYGAKIIPYYYDPTTSAYDYSGGATVRNPFIIEKRTSPHLSLDRLSGIRLVGFDADSPGTIRGLKIPINEKLNASSKLNAIQMFIYYDATTDPDQSSQDVFQFEEVEIFNIVASDRVLTTSLINTGGYPIYEDTATIYTASTVGSGNQDIQYYINGELSTTPTIKTNEWVVFTIVFTNPITFDNFAGSFNITGPLAFDNITFYGTAAIDFLISKTDRDWSNVKYQPNGLTYTWNSWTGETWNDLATMYDFDNYPLNPSKMYGLYAGTNILYPGQYDQTKRTLVKDIQYSFYGGYRTAKYTYS